MGTYAQKISELQKPIPGQTVPVPSLPVKRVMPKETNLAATSLRLPSNQSSSMPSLIPLTIDDMAIGIPQNCSRLCTALFHPPSTLQAAEPTRDPTVRCIHTQSKPFSPDRCRIAA